MAKRGSVKPKSDPNIHNMYNPAYAGKIEFAFESEGIKYHSFKADTDMRYGRYLILQTFMQEYYLRTDLDTLKADISSLKKFLNPVINKDGRGQLEIGKSLELLEIMEQRANIAFEPSTVYRLASCLYFDDEEIISDYDIKYNEKKIERWREAGNVDFFFGKLFQELTGLKDISKDALKNYLAEVPKLLSGWTKVRDILKR